MNPRPNILISHVYSSHNNGDAAILSAQIGELRRTFPDAHVSILSIDQIESGYTFEGIPVSNALMYGSVAPTNGRFKKLLLAFSMITYTSLWTTARRVIHVSLPLPRIWAEPMHLLVDADMQVCVGGGYLRAKDDWVSTILLALLFHQIWLAKSLGVPVYLYAQSFGPYPKRVQRKIAAAGLRHADLILAREAKSMALLESMGLTGDWVTKVPDSAFTFRPQVQFDARTVLGAGRPHEMLVGITVRSWLHDADQARYERAMAEFIDWLSRCDGVRVAVIAQVTSAAQNDDDRVVGRRIRTLLGEKNNVTFLDERYTHHEVRQLFGALTYLVGTRFHSVIFALSAGVPAVAIEYEHKTSGIMHDLGLDEWVLPMDEVTADKLIALFESLLSETANYRHQLNQALPPYIERGHESADMIQRAYGSARRAPSASASSLV